MSKNKTFFVFYVLFVTLFIIGCSSPIAEKESSSYVKKVYPEKNQSNGVGNSVNYYRKLSALPDISQTLLLFLEEIQIGKTTRQEVEQGICGPFRSFRTNEHGDFSRLGLAAYTETFQTEGWGCDVSDPNGSFDIYFNDSDIVYAIHYWSFNDDLFIEKLMHTLGKPTIMYFSYDIDKPSGASMPDGPIISYSELGFEIELAVVNINPQKDVGHLIISNIPLNYYLYRIIIFESLSNVEFRQVYARGNFEKIDWTLVPAK